MKQTTNTLLMIEPTNFGFNLDAAQTNSFQKPAEDLTDLQVQDSALLEFQQMVRNLKAADVDVITFQDLVNSTTPDSIFPNNWFSTHPDGRLITYPMAPVNRRAERRQDIVDYLMVHFGYKEHIKLEKFEERPKPKFLEGTGSVVLDRINKLAYAALSPRTELEPLEEFCTATGFKPVTFKAYGPSNELIYHTNVMLCIGDTFAVAGLEVVDEQDRNKLLQHLNNSGKEVIELTKSQTHHSFAGNMLQVENKHGQKILVLSQAAYDSLSQEQLKKLEQHNHQLMPFPVHLIERCGGGSVRCMIAEIFKPEN